MSYNANRFIYIYIYTALAKIMEHQWKIEIMIQTYIFKGLE